MLSLGFLLIYLALSSIGIDVNFRDFDPDYSLRGCDFEEGLDVGDVLGHGPVRYRSSIMETGPSPWPSRIRQHCRKSGLWTAMD